MQVRRIWPSTLAQSVLLMILATTAQAGSNGETHATKSRYGNPIDHSMGWARPRSDERSAERLTMVEHQLVTRDIHNQAVLDAMRRVPRHWFVPQNAQSYVYRDRPAPIGDGQTISQPYIVAFMTQALALDKNSKVLEIGTGSGYQAAVLTEFTPHVYTIEIVEPLAQRAWSTFKRHGYDTVKMRIGDGYAGWMEHAPFDAVIVTCAPDHVPPALIKQLKPGGRICIPVGESSGSQWLRRITKQSDGSLEKEDLMPVRFVPMTGDAQQEKDRE